MGAKVLIIEDEETMVEGLTYNLGKEGFEVSVALDGETGVSMARLIRPDLVLLDLMLPGMDGLDVCRTLRRESRVPIIMLTAKTTEMDKVVGLELGADDYITKPFSVRELVARIHAVMRRTGDAGPVQPERFTFRHLTIDFERHLVTVSGKAVDLSPKEYHLLRTLVAHRGRVLRREELLQMVWGHDVFVDQRTVDVHVRWLREKIEEEAGRPVLIQTVRGAGYRFGD
ncbi:MAG: response regulator transcription factor [Armatimonadetes bacterium]|nr:response regulator transcription factor [Armatimonadota bacterium]